MIYLSAVVSVPGHESAGSSSIPDEGSRRRPHPGLHPSLSGWSINGYLGQPREDKLWEPGCHIGPMSRGKGFLSTTGVGIDYSKSTKNIFKQNYVITQELE